MAIVGTAGDDVLNGTIFNDVIQGLAGADYITANEGNDTVFGGLGNDIIYAYTGNDNIYGQGGNDQLFASAGDDTAIGGLGNDTINGETGNDVLLGDDGDDFIVGGFGSDFMSGGTGNDTLDSHGGPVSNFVIEIDDMSGGAGADLFRLRTDYLGGAASLNPLIDGSHAIIRDFTIGEDTLDMRYDKNYTIRYGNFFGDPTLDTILSYKGNVVAVAQDVHLTSANLA